mgnify:CR=1 FL=1
MKITAQLALSQMKVNKKDDCRNFCDRTCNITYYNCNVLCDKRK